MYNVRKVTSDLFMTGASDNRLALFENVYPVPDGMSYNSYLLADEKTVLFDTADSSVRRQFLENLEFALGGRPLDYAVIQHMEPDHCAELADLMKLYPDAKIVCSLQAKKMTAQFFDLPLPDERFFIIKEGDVLQTGRHTLRFISAPMVHWPEVMMTYDETDKILFSADAFGSFGMLCGNIFADEVSEFKIGEARRYYANIVGKYGVQVQSVLKKASALDIRMICPLHGLIWRDNLPYILGKYAKWAAYEPEEKAVVIAYASIYGNTYNAVSLLASEMAELGVKDIKMYDVSKTHPSYIIGEIFRASALVLASPAYDGGIFINMAYLLHDMAAHNIQNRSIALMDNGTWAPVAGKQMRDALSALKNIDFIEPQITLKSALKENQLPEIRALAAAIAAKVL